MYIHIYISLTHRKRAKYTSKKYLAQTILLTPSIERRVLITLVLGPSGTEHESRTSSRTELLQSLRLSLAAARGAEICGIPLRSSGLPKGLGDGYTISFSWGPSSRRWSPGGGGGGVEEGLEWTATWDTTLGLLRPVAMLLEAVDPEQKKPRCKSYQPPPPEKKHPPNRDRPLAQERNAQSCKKKNKAGRKSTSPSSTTAFDTFTNIHLGPLK